MMLNSLDARPELRYYNQLNYRRTENQDNQDNYMTFSLNIWEPIDTDQTFLKERYIENNEETRLIGEDESNSYWPANRITDSEPVIPRQPEECWNLKLLLVRLSKEITENDLEIIKFLLTGLGEGDCTRCLQNASSLKVFDLLQTRNFITSKDLLYLQMLLAAIGKESLIDMVYKYAQNTDNVLHFDPPLTNTVVCDHLTEISVRGADFRCYTTTELEEFYNRVRRIVAVYPDNKNTATTHGRLRIAIPCLQDETDGTNEDLLVYEINESCDSPEGSHMRYSAKRNYVVICDTGMQTEVGIIDDSDLQCQHTLEEENEHLRRQLDAAKYHIQVQAREISEMKKKLKNLETLNLQFYEDEALFLTESPESADASENADWNCSLLNKVTKDVEYELNSLKKEHHLLTMKASLLSEETESLLTKYNDAQLEYEEAEKENKELKIEKTNTEIQIAILNRDIDNLKEKLKTRIEEENSLITGLKNELEMTTASLLNAQNDKRLYELTRCLEQIASMSMTVKKVYGNFDPAHEHISPKQEELFRKALSGKIGRIYPQIYYRTT